MNPALATCAAGPPWFGPISAVPSTVPSSATATSVRPGGGFIHRLRADASSVSVSHENVSPARMIPRMNAHIAGQSAAVASRISITCGRRR